MKNCFLFAILISLFACNSNVENTASNNDAAIASPTGYPDSSHASSKSNRFPANILAITPSEYRL
jgi:hypothetical protein